MNEGDTYKFVDEEKTYRVMTNIENLGEYFSSEDENRGVYPLQNVHQCKYLHANTKNPCCDYNVCQIILVSCQF